MARVWPSWAGEGFSGGHVLSHCAEKPRPLCSRPPWVLAPDWLALPPCSPLCALPESRPRGRWSLASRCLLAPASLPRAPPREPTALPLCAHCSLPGPGPPGWGIPAPPAPWIPASQSGGCRAFLVGVSPGPLVGVGGGSQASVASAGGFLHGVLAAGAAEGAPGTQSPEWNRGPTAFWKRMPRLLVWTPCRTEPSQAVTLRS